MRLSGKQFHLCFQFFLFTVVLFFLGADASCASENNLERGKRYMLQKGVITEIVEERIMPPHGIHTRPKGYKLVKVKITSGERKGEVFQTKARLSAIPGLGVDARPGLRVLVHLIERKDGAHAAIVDYNRERYVYLITGIFFGLLIIIGKMKGVKSIVALGCTLMMIFYILLPLLKRGYSPIPVSIATAIVINIIVFLILSGFTNKSFTAIVGTSFGVALAGLTGFAVGALSHTTGIPFEEARMLYFRQMGTPLDFRGLIFAGVLIGSLGAVMDVAMSIASSLEEIKIHKQGLSGRELFHSGMNVGRDIMGTMSNTLILAYVGGSIAFLLLLLKLEKPYQMIINSNLIVGEIIQGLAGAIGIVLAVPLTAFAGSYLSRWKRTG